MTVVSLQQLESLARRALLHAGATDAMAASTAHALMTADAQGLASHGVARVAQYVAHLNNGRANGRATARRKHLVQFRSLVAGCLADCVCR